MTFLHIEYLYFILPILLFVFLLIVMQKESKEHYFSKEILDKLSVKSNSLTQKTRTKLLFLVVLLMALAAAEPVLKDGTLRVKATGGDILVALDISDSMLTQDLYPNRLEVAKKKAQEFISSATKDRVGVIAFAKNSYLVSPISFDKKTVSFLLSKLDTSSITQKGTDLLTMLETVAKTKTSTDQKYLLILSDGGDAKEFTTEIEYANKQGITIFILGIGTEVGMQIKKSDGSFVEYKNKTVISKLNPNIAQLAIETGGIYIQNSTSSEDVEKMLDEIVNNSQHKELKSQEIQRYVPLFYYPLILAVLLLLMAFSSANITTLFLALLLSNSPSVADYFDFKKLSHAKALYEAQEYNASAQIYKDYAQKNNNGEAYYNAGNAFYKEQEYTKALSAYSFAEIEDKKLRASKLSNMGNALVHLGTLNSLERAIKHYEASLRLIEDKETREDLEAVKKALEEAKAKEKKEAKEKKKEDDTQYSEQKTDENGDDSDEADDKNSKNKNKNSGNKGGSKGKQSENDSDSKNSNKANDSKAKESDQKSGDDSNSESGNSQEQTKKLQERDKNKNETKNKSGSAKAGLEAQGMSDLEEAKWVKKLNSKQNTYLYRLNEKRAGNTEKNEKPW